MNRSEQHRAVCVREAGARWWRDGLFGLIVGAVSGGFLWMAGVGVAPQVLVPSVAVAVAGAVLAALFGPRVLHLLR